MPYNLDDYFETRPKPNVWVYFSLFTFIFVVWSHREGSDEITFLSDVLFFSAIAGFSFYCAYLVAAFSRARLKAMQRYQQYLSTCSKAQLEQLLLKDDLSPKSSTLVRQFLITHYPGS